MMQSADRPSNSRGIGSGATSLSLESNFIFMRQQSNFNKP